MAYLIAVSDLIATAATDVASIGSTLSEAHTAATARTVALVPAAADEVSERITQIFSRYAQRYHSLARQAAGFHENFVQHLKASAGWYAGVEAANATSLHASPGLVPSAHATAVSHGKPPIYYATIDALAEAFIKKCFQLRPLAVRILNSQVRIESLLQQIPIIGYGLSTIFFVLSLPIAIPALIIVVLTAELP